MITMSDLHNALAGEVVKAIVKPTLDSGGDFTDVMVILESVVVGVVLMGVRLGGDEKVLDRMMTNVKGRLAEIRLKDIPTEGRH